jgi:signal transduction histidine kinase
MRSPATLRGRLALWTGAAALVGLLVFAAVAYLVVSLDEQSEADAGVPDDPETVGAEAREQMLIALAIAAPIAIALAIAAARWASRRAMTAIERAAATAAEISVDRFDRRMEVPAAGDELRPLAVAVNDLVDRLQHGYQALAAFSADASHELRTPLAAVCSELEVGLRRPRSAEYWESAATTSLAELRRLANVVESMLRFAQAGAGRDADAADVELADLVEEVVAIHGEAAARGGVTLRAELGTEAAVVHGDASMLATALTNLVTNAVRVAGPSGTVAIAIVRRDAATFAIHVDDTGPGLPADRSAVFTPFARIGSDRSGIGLGLAIAQRIAQRHGGAIAFADRPEGGTRFTIDLPCRVLTSDARGI